MNQVNMKKLLYICLFVILGMTANAQQVYQEFTAIDIEGDTSTVVSADVKYNGVITFDYTFTGNSVGDTAYVDFQASNDDWTTYQTISTTTLIAGTTAANQHLVDNPSEYMNYRLNLRAYEVGDTVAFTNLLFIFKK